MESPPQSTLSLPEPFGFFFLFLHAILSWIASLHKFFTPTSSQPWPKAASEKKQVTLQISREDVSTVMGCMGLTCSREDGDQDQLMSFEELTNMFEEKEPSLGEVKHAFGVFDENCDGFIDAGELQRVLGKLGFGEGLELELEECERMVEECDENGDGRIEFSEFVKFMESGFC